MRPDSKPNVLWIQTDEQRPDSLACYGSAWAKTPGFSRIAGRGTVFANAVCSSPMCLPSRSAQMAARYPHEFGCLNNMVLKHVDGYPEGFRTFPEVLHDAGYETVNFGRYHCLAKEVFERNERTGDCMSEFTGYSALNARYDEREYHVVKRPGPDGRPLIVAGTYPGETDSNRISLERAISFLASGEAGRKRPFLLSVSFNQPHTPTLAPPPFDSLYDPAALPVRHFDPETLATRSAFDRKYAALHRMDLLSEDQYRQVWKDYMGLCAYVDSLVHRLLDALEESGLADDTVVFCSTDHGKSLGEWGAGEKGTFDREVWRVPFIWSFPGVVPEATTVEAPCGTIDTARTLLGLLGLSASIPESWRGRDLFAAGESLGSGAEELAFGVIRSPADDAPGLDPRIMRVAVRSRRFRLDVNRYIDGSAPPADGATGVDGPTGLDGSLYDLDSDPQERVNRFADPGFAADRAVLLAAIDRWLAAHPAHPMLLDPSKAGVWF